MPVTAWTIFTHNSVLATAHPDCATRNVYGDPYLTDLCPANPRVRAYCRELASDIAQRYPVQRLLAESLHYRPLEHGEHHERYLIPLPPEARTLTSLCFCPHCRVAGQRAGDGLCQHEGHVEADGDGECAIEAHRRTVGAVLGVAMTDVVLALASVRHDQG